VTLMATIHSPWIVEWRVGLSQRGSRLPLPHFLVQIRFAGCYSDGCTSSWSNTRSFRVACADSVALKKAIGDIEWYQYLYVNAQMTCMNS